MALQSPHPTSMAAVTENYIYLRKRLTCSPHLGPTTTTTTTTTNNNNNNDNNMPKSARKSILKQASDGPLQRNNKNVRFAATRHRITQRKNVYVYYMHVLPEALESPGGEPSALHDVFFEGKSRYEPLLRGALITITVELPETLAHVRWPPAVVVRDLGLERSGDRDEGDGGDGDDGDDENEEKWEVSDKEEEQEEEEGVADSEDGLV
ncbi:hypothetical protein FN846DRAFT_1010505 [Sphaerosporella brunnea]|uniref:Uncharacterized protein n=1 Tax=Sphaerosporella brunnea TaxID=1250544 RepID=A0A5J5EZD9_9PEZI|nr:hypothetical protein FN846DRAFT_1010505 [Sphaerosporella brunnea]